MLRSPTTGGNEPLPLLTLRQLPGADRDPTFDRELRGLLKVAADLTRAHVRAAVIGAAVDQASDAGHDWPHELNADPEDSLFGGAEAALDAVFQRISHVLRCSGVVLRLERAAGGERPC